MSSSESYEDETTFVSGDEEENSNNSNSSSRSNIDEEGTEDISRFFMGLQPYQYEPERISNIETEDDTESSEEEMHNQPAEEQPRVGNTVWCKCESCHSEDRELDCLCCQEVAAIAEEKFTGKRLIIICSILKIKYYFLTIITCCW